MKRLLLLTTLGVMTPAMAGCGGLTSWLYRGDACATVPGPGLSGCDGCQPGAANYGADTVLPPVTGDGLPIVPGMPFEQIPTP